MAPKKTKRTADSINSRLALVMKSGKVTLGYKSVLKTLRSGKAKLVIIAGQYTSFQDVRRAYLTPILRQHTSSPQVRARVLLHAFQDTGPPLLWQQRTCTIHITPISMTSKIAREIVSASLDDQLFGATRARPAKKSYPRLWRVNKKN